MPNGGFVKKSVKSLLLVAPLLLMTACSQVGTNAGFESANGQSAASIIDEAQDSGSEMAQAPSNSSLPAACEDEILNQSNIDHSYEIEQGTVYVYTNANGAGSCLMEYCTGLEISISN
jgi:hypothetical protein